MTKLTTFGPIEDNVLQQINTCIDAGDAEYAVLCGDNHLGYSQPIGAAIAYKNYISPSGVGYDIGCGNKAMLTNLMADDIDVNKVMDEIVQRISFGMGRSNDESVDHPILDKIVNADFIPQRKFAKLAADQLGTVGSGNHYVDLFKDEQGRLWVGVHFGSRGFGHKTASGFIALSQGLEFGEHAHEGEMMSPPILFEIGTQLAEDYISAMTLAGEYAYAGRDVVVSKVLEILGAKEVESIHNHHNFAWYEEHFGEKYWVVRKGCTPAFPGQKGFVGANMGGTSVILEGVDSELSREALYSTVHGAGRVMGRRQAAGVFKFKQGKLVQVKPGLVDFEEVKRLISSQKIELRGGGADESPQVYKNLDEVLQLHDGTIKILHRLQPIGVAMAGLDTYDAYKD